MIRRGYDARFSACSKSSIRSEVASIPTDTRTRPSAMPSFLRSSAPMPTCELVAGADHQRLHAAEAGRDDGDRQRREEALGRLEAAFQLEAEHAAEAVEQRPGARVARGGSPGQDS